jgi:hypothetical protein
MNIYEVVRCTIVNIYNGFMVGYNRRKYIHGRMVVRGFVENIPVFFNTGLIRQTLMYYWLSSDKFILAMALWSEELAAPVIVLPDNFDSFNIAVKDFLLFHEMGHVMLGHLTYKISTRERISDRISNIRNGSIQGIEKEADEYAVAKIGIEQTLAALAIMDETFPNKPEFKLVKTELKLRYSYLKNKFS